MTRVTGDNPSRYGQDSDRLAAAVKVRRITIPLSRRAVLAGAASGAALLAGLGACGEPASPAAIAIEPGATPRTSVEPKPAPSRANYRPKLIVQRAEPNDRTRIALADWRLRVDGLVGKPLELTYDDLKKYPSVVQTSALHCVETWSVADLRWEGIRLATLLQSVEPLSTARWVQLDTFPGVYQDSLSLEQAALEDVLVAYGLGGAPLTEDLGFPVRLVVPRMYGYKSVKWLNRISLVAERPLGFWERSGYPPDAWFS